jgi:threonine/homoserine/homoserine lactone efflux protein
MDRLWAFLLLALVLSLTPGPDDVLVLSSALRGGTRSGAATALGAATGALMWGGATAVGLAAVVSESATTYDAIRLAGAAYLVVLGILPLVTGALHRAHPVPIPLAHARSPGSGPRLRPAFAAGLASDLLNPKIGLFYVAVVPQFIPPGQAMLAWSLLLCAIDVAVALTWLLALTWMAHAAVGWLQRPAVVRCSQACFSVCLIVIGGSVALGT